MNCLKKISFAPLAMLLCVAFFAGAVSAQQITATLSGEVRDQSGAVVPGASVTVTSVDTGLIKTATTNDNGNYTVTFLQPGTYNVKVDKSGFAPTTRENIKLEVAQTASIDIDLGVTAGSVTVDVDSSETPILQTETSNLETTVEQKLIEDLPSSERNIFSFISLVPGTIDTGAALPNNALGQGPIGSSGNRNFFDSNFALNGGRASTNDNLLDGITNTLGDANGVAISPPQDAVREFKVISGVAPAEYGRTGGGIVTVSTKSGTRKFHGALYEYFQDGNLNANGFRNNRNSIARVNDAIKHQFGGAVGGPLYFFNFGENDGGIAKKLEKTFFFTNYELRREKNPSSRILTVPTARMRTGDLSELLTGATRPGLTNRDGTPALFGQIYNPFTSTTTAGVTRRDYFANNDLSSLPVCTPATDRVNTPCKDPVALAVLQYLPLPNRPGLFNNYAFSGNSKFKRDLVSGRVDHTVSDKQNFFVRFNYEKRSNATADFLGTGAAPVTVQKDSFFNSTLNHVYSLTPTLINNFRYGYTRGHAKQPSNSLGFNPTSLGFAPNLASSASVLVFPTFTIGNGTAGGEIGAGVLGASGNDQPRDTHNASDSVTWVKGSHTLRIGAEYRLYRFYPFQFTGGPSGNFSFSRTATAGPVPTAAVSPIEAAGSSFASFLLGIPSAISRDVQTPITIYHHYGAGYVQDDWKILRNLTLNLGLRWDFETGTASSQQLITSFDPNAAAPIAGTVQTQLNTITLDPTVAQLNPGIRNLTGLLTFPKGAQTKTNFDRFAPRIGFAYSINNKTTLRGGFGLFFLPISLEGTSALGTSFSDALTQTTNVQVSSSTRFLSNPFPNGTRSATGNTQGSFTGLGTSLGAVVEPKRANPYVMQWNLVIQRELAKNFVLDIAYVGSAGRNLPSRNVNLNQLPLEVLDYARANYNKPNTCGAIACTTVAAFLNFAVPNPLQGSIPAGGQVSSGATISRAQLLRRFPQYLDVFDFNPHIGFSNYHALQVNLQKRFSNGFSLLTNYVWSKLLDTGGVGSNVRGADATNAEDAFNFEQEYSYSTLDVPHRFTLSGTYELPFGKSKRFGKNWNGLTNALLGGFQISGTGVWQRGTPLAITNSVGFPTTGQAGVGQGAIRPNRISGENAMPGNFGDLARQGLSVFNSAVFSAPDVTNYQFGDAARTYNDIRRDNYKNVDLSIIKNVSIGDGGQKLQIRGEFLNAFNTVVFGTPIVTFGSATFGTFANQDVQLGNRPRIIQLVGRFTF